MAIVTVAAGQTLDTRNFGFGSAAGTTTPAAEVGSSGIVEIDLRDDGDASLLGTFRSLDAVPLPRSTYGDPFAPFVPYTGSGTYAGAIGADVELLGAGGGVLGRIEGVTLSYSLVEHYSNLPGVPPFGTGPAWAWTISVDPSSWLDRADVVELAGGDDWFEDPQGRLTLWGGAGNDTILSLGDHADAADRIRGEAGDDRIDLAGSSGSTVWGGDGNDAITFAGHATRVWGGAGDDAIAATGGPFQAEAWIDAGTGADEVAVTVGTVAERAGSGDDTYECGSVFGILSYAGNAAAVVVFESDFGQRTDYGAYGQDLITGFTRIVGSNGNDVLGGAGSDNSFSGAAGDDVLDGGGGDDLLHGGAGSDWLTGGAGADRLVGGTGSDWASYLDGGAVAVSLAPGFAPGGPAVGDVLLGIENLEGSNEDDTLWGNFAANSLVGSHGDDTLRGRAGADVLTGDGYGGAPGADVFVFDTGLSPTNVDRITDFEVGLDSIRLSDSVFLRLTATGPLAEESFALGAATSAAQHVIYDAATGELFYDRDGVGADHVRVLFAQLAAGLALGASDFEVT